MILFLLLLASADAETITVPIRRNLPQGAELAAQEERVLPLKHTGCDGIARLKSLDYSLTVEQKGQEVLISMPVDPVIEKIAKGPLFPPSLVVHLKTKAPITFVFENAMASAQWENGGAFRETFQDRALVDAKFWDSLELVCSSESPYHAARIPDDVTYKQADDQKLEAAVAKLKAGLRGPEGFGSAGMYGGMAIIGPDLYAKLKGEPSFANVKSPKMVSIDPATKKERGMLRFQGEDEIAILGAAMRRYIGFVALRIRAATSTELAAHWLNIGWGIEEPILVADYGAHRFIVDFDEDGSPWFIDELP